MKPRQTVVRNDELQTRCIHISMFCISRFEHVLKAAGFNEKEAAKEWPKVKRFVRRKYGQLRKYQHSVWSKFLTAQQNQYPHCGLLVQIMLVILCSSSAVERGFSAVRRQLSDQRVLMKHSLLDESLRIKVNMPALRQLHHNCESLVVERAIAKYHSKKKWRWNVEEPVSKKERHRMKKRIEGSANDARSRKD